MHNILGIIVFLLIVGSVYLFYGVRDHLTQYSRDKSSLEYYEKKIKRLQGSTLMLGPQAINYNFLSFDNGNTWVEVDSNDAIIRKANPKVLKHVLSINRLMNQVSDNGPLNLNSKDDIKLLKDSGFSVK